MRDTLKDKNYFDLFISEDTARIERFLRKIEAGEVKEERILPVKRMVHQLKLGILIARYSRGDALELLEEEYLKLVDTWEEVWSPESYNLNLRMISLAVLLGLERERALRIKLMLEKSNINDWLFAFLLDSILEENTSEDNEMLFPESFSTLRKMTDAENKMELVKHYLLKEWYNKDCGCYEAHKSAQNIYYGYWSFEAGAITKILKVKDDELEGVSYYPYDLVHYIK